jgi:membrane-associated phospholipid phosphatase
MKLLRWPLMILALIFALGGGFAQFYIGFHLVTDLVAGYLLGISAACCGIGLLLRYEAQRKKIGWSQPAWTVIAGSIHDLWGRAGGRLTRAKKSIE